LIDGNVKAPTNYFTREEYGKLIVATYLYRENRGEAVGGPNATRVRTLIRLMRWSGLRIRDAITLERTCLIHDNLLLYQAETETPSTSRFPRRSRPPSAMFLRVRSRPPVRNDSSHLLTTCLEAIS
jgi:hypothetical protein